VQFRYCWYSKDDGLGLKLKSQSTESYELPRASAYSMPRRGGSKFTKKSCLTNGEFAKNDQRISNSLCQLPKFKGCTIKCQRTFKCNWPNPSRREKTLKGSKNSQCIGCPTLGVAWLDPSNKIDYDGLRRFSSFCTPSIHVNTSLQSFHPLEQTSTNVSPGTIFKTTWMRTRSSDKCSARYPIRFLFT
jgi:hypothetical protein